jgi:hypothetical protein
MWPPFSFVENQEKRKPRRGEGWRGFPGKCERVVLHRSHDRECPKPIKDRLKVSVNSASKFRTIIAMKTRSCRLRLNHVASRG